MLRLKRNLSCRVWGSPVRIRSRSRIQALHSAQEQVKGIQVPSQPERRGRRGRRGRERERRRTIRAQTQAQAVHSKGGGGDQVKDIYTHGHHPSVVSQHSARTAADSAGFLLPHLKPGLRCLDVGCGPGSISVGLAHAVGPTGLLMAVDVEKEVVKQCTRRFEEAGVSTFASSTVASVYHLNEHFEENTFDICYANQVLQHLSDPVKALREMKRVVKHPGGIIAVRDADYASMLCHPSLPGIDRWREVYRKTARKNGAEPDAGRHLMNWTVSSKVFQEENVEFTTEVKVYDSSDEEARRSWALSWRDRCLHSAFAGQAVDYGVCTRQEMREMARDWEKWSTEPQGVFYYVIGQALIKT